MFLDSSEEASAFSIVHLIRQGANLGLPIGQQFTPTILARVLRRQCKAHPELPFHIYIVKDGIIQETLIRNAAKEKPTVVLINLRLGVETLNSDYNELIKGSLCFPLSLGVIGGRTSRAFYIVGFQDDSLLYLDPHLLRPICTDLNRIIKNRELHTRAVCELSLNQLDPTLLFGFLCQNQTDVNTLVEHLRAIHLPSPIFSFTL